MLVYCCYGVEQESRCSPHHLSRHDSLRWAVAVAGGARAYCVWPDQMRVVVYLLPKFGLFIMEHNSRLERDLFIFTYSHAFSLFIPYSLSVPLDRLSAGRNYERVCCLDGSFNKPREAVQGCAPSLFISHDTLRHTYKSERRYISFIVQTPLSFFPIKSWPNPEFIFNLAFLCPKSTTRPPQQPQLTVCTINLPTSCDKSESQENPPAICPPPPQPTTQKSSSTTTNPPAPPP